MKLKAAIGSEWKEEFKNQSRTLTANPTGTQMKVGGKGKKDNNNNWWLSRNINVNWSVSQFSFLLKDRAWWTSGSCRKWKQKCPFLALKICTEKQFLVNRMITHDDYGLLYVLCKTGLGDTIVNNFFKWFNVSISKYRSNH